METILKATERHANFHKLESKCYYGQMKQMRKPQSRISLRADIFAKGKTLAKRGLKNTTSGVSRCESRTEEEELKMGG